jgi:hypothetical protein
MRYLGRKSQTAMAVNEGMLILRLLFMVFVAMSIVVLVNKFVALNADVGPAERNILANRFLISPSCLAYTDKIIDRPYPGIIDLSRFNSTVLDSCIYFGKINNYAAANLTLQFIGPGTKMSAVYNELGYAVFRPKAGIEGAGGSTLFTDTRYVLVMDKGELKKALITIELLTPNK